MKSKKFIFPILLLSFACTHTQEDNVLTIKIRPGDVSENLKLSDLVSEVEFIKLQDCDDCLVGEINKVVAYKDKYYLTPKSYSEGNILVFSKDGKFLFQFGRKGGGPDEYSTLHDFSIDSKKNEALILSSRKILIYNPDDGSLIRTEDFPFQASELKMADDYYYSVSLSDSVSLRISDKDMNVVSEKFRTFKRNVGTGAYILHPYHDSLLVNSGLYDTIYSLYQDKARVSRIIDFGSDALSEGDIGAIDFNNMREFERIMKTRMCNIYVYLETDDIILFHFLNKGTPVAVLYNKNSKTLTAFPTKIGNDITLEPQFPALSSTEDDKYFIGLTTNLPAILDKLDEGSDKSETATKLKKALEGVTIASNPVLFKIRFKDNN